MKRRAPDGRRPLRRRPPRHGPGRGPRRGADYGPGALLRRAGRDDLVVVGAGDGPGLSGFARAAVTGAAAPVLVERAAARDTALGDRRLVVRAGDGRTAREIVRAARARAATLVVLERAACLALAVAERAPCSVLVLRTFPEPRP